MAILGKTSITELEVINQIKSNVATGTPPLDVDSTTVVANLNADLLDGYHASGFLKTTDAATSANKLNTNAGSATLPVYFSNGVPVAVTASSTASNLISALGEGTAAPSDETWYITSINTGTGTTFYKRPHSNLYTYLKGKFDSVYTDTATTQNGHYTPSTSASTLGATSGNNYIRGINLDSKNHVISVATGTPTSTSNYVNAQIDTATTLYFLGTSGTTDEESYEKSYTNRYFKMRGPEFEIGDYNAFAGIFWAPTIINDPTLRIINHVGGIDLISDSGVYINGDMVTDTLNTAGSSNSTSKLYLIGATSQNSAGVQTYSNASVYMSGGKLYANGSEVATQSTVDDTVSALTVTCNSLNNRVTALEDGGTGGGLNVVSGSSKTYLIGTSSSSSSQTLTQGNFNSSVYIQSGECHANAFYQTSDERLKDFYDEIGVDFDELKSIPKKYFSWKDKHKDGIDIGTSAQALQKVYPELVSEGEEGLTVDYARLSIVALKAIDKLHEENEMLKEMLIKMDERLSKLENEK